METVQPKNLSIEYNTRLPGYINGNPGYVAALDGKIKTTLVICPRCGHSNYVDNGYHDVQDAVITSLGLNIKIAQFACKTCGYFWSTAREIIDQLIQAEKELVKSLMLGCVRRGLSLENSCSLIEETLGRGYSPQYLHELYVQVLDHIERERFSSASGVYNYDEQYLKVNGEECCRLTIRDTVTGKIVFDERTSNAQSATIRATLAKALKGLHVDAFIIDMNTRYPEIIAELYPNAKIQWCIFHLDKLIWKELHDEFGKNIQLQQHYNAYLLFNIFFDHTVELEKLEELLEKFNRYKFNDPKLDKQVEHCLLQEFGQFIKALKRERRRKHERRPRRTLKQSIKTFTRIQQEILLFPKALQKRIRFIDENWDKFTLFQRDARVQPTNNGIEQYFGATLAKTDKKDFRSKAAVTRELRACQAEWNGAKLFSTTKLDIVLALVGVLFRAFPP